MVHVASAMLLKLGEIIVPEFNGCVTCLGCNPNFVNQACGTDCTGIQAKGPGPHAMSFKTVLAAGDVFSRIPSLKWFQLDVLEPAISPVVLQTDVTFPRVVFVSNVELVGGAIRTSVRFGPFVEIDL